MVISNCHMAEFGEWLQAELERRNLSQKDFALRAGITPAQVSRIITGARNAGEDSLLAIARALRMAPEELFRVAGVLPSQSAPDPQAEEARRIVVSLPPARKQQAIDYLVFLTTLDKGR